MVAPVIPVIHSAPTLLISLELTAARLRLASGGLLPPRPTAYIVNFFLTPQNTMCSVFINDHHNL